MSELLDRIKERVAQRDSPIRTVKGVAEAIGMSEAGFYVMLRRKTTKPGTMLAIAKSLEVEPNFFDSDKNNANSLYKDSPGSPEQEVNDFVMMNQSLQEMKRIFEEQLRVKDTQIAGLQEMLKMILGKLEGADLDQLFHSDDVEMNLKKYEVVSIAKNIIPMLVDSSIFLPQSVAK